MSATRQANGKLAAAAKALSLPGMRRALSSGANDLKHAAELVISHDDPATATRATAQQIAGKQVAALQLLCAAHGGLGVAAATRLLYKALDHYCDPAVVRCLLDAGADAASCTVFGDAVLLHTRRADAAEMLIAAGADAAGPRPAFTPLHLAASVHFDPDLVRVLVNGGAKVNAWVINGKTPLDYVIERAAGIHVLPSASLLLELGADPNVGMQSKSWTWYSDDDSSTLGYVKAMIVEREEYCGDFGYDPEFALFIVDLAKLVVHAAAWHRRRHALLALRSRYPAPAAPAAAGAATAVGGSGTGGSVSEAAAGTTA